MHRFRRNGNGSRRTTLLVLLVAAAFAGGALGTPVLREVVSWMYQEDYETLVFRCDQAMREHFLAKARTAADPGPETAAVLATTEVALIDCHDYDLLRKKLGRFGLDDADLAAMGLRAIERRGKDIREIVRIHEIRY